jgi:hypothetical protein
MSQLSESRENMLKNSPLPYFLRPALQAVGMVMVIICTTAFPAIAEDSGNVLERLFPWHGPSPLFSTTTSTREVEKPPQVPFKQDEMTPLGPPGPTILDTLQASISKNLLQSSQWLDSFFYDPRFAAEENETRAALRYEGFIEEHARLAFKTKVQLVLVLPQLKNKAHLVIAGDPSENNPNQLGQPLLPPPIGTNRSTTAALGYELLSDEVQNINAKLGLRYRNGHLVVFVRPHYRRLYHLEEGWDLRFTQEFPYWTDTKWSSSTTIDLERPFGKEYFFRASLNGSWYEEQPGYTYGLLFSLTQPLSSTSAMSYDLGGSFQTGAPNATQKVLFPGQPPGGLGLRSDHGAHDILVTVAVDTRYRQRFWRDWLYFDITPQVRFPRDRRFNPVPGILFGLEAQFGKAK